MAPVNSKIERLIESLTREVLQEALRGFKFNQFKTMGDLTVWNHWGKTIDGNVKLLDYVVTSDIIKRLYS